MHPLVQSWLSLKYLNLFCNKCNFKTGISGLSSGISLCASCFDEEAQRDEGSLSLIPKGWSRIGASHQVVCTRTEENVLD